MPGESKADDDRGDQEARGRPRVTLNVAVSLDGRIAGAGGRRLLLSDPEDQNRVHRMRAEQEAILVGIGTVIQDDPALTVRGDRVKAPRNPVRVVLDSHGRTPRDARVLDAAAPTWIYCAQGTRRRAHQDPPEEHRWVGVPAAADGGLVLTAVLADLAANGVGSLMVEGGSRVIASFLAAGLVDEAFVFVAPVVVGEGAPSLAAMRARDDTALMGFRVLEAQKRETGVLLQLAPKTRT